MCFSLTYHQSLHEKCFQALSRLGITKPLNPETMKALQGDSRVFISEKSKHEELRGLIISLVLLLLLYLISY